MVTREDAIRQVAREEVEKLVKSLPKEEGKPMPDEGKYCSTCHQPHGASQELGNLKTQLELEKDRHQRDIEVANQLQNRLSGYNLETMTEAIAEHLEGCRGANCTVEKRIMGAIEPKLIERDVQAVGRALERMKIPGPENKELVRKLAKIHLEPKSIKLDGYSNETAEVLAATLNKIFQPGGGK